MESDNSRNFWETYSGHLSTLYGTWKKIGLGDKYVDNLFLKFVIVGNLNMLNINNIFGYKMWYFYFVLTFFPCLWVIFVILVNSLKYIFLGTIND